MSSESRWEVQAPACLTQKVQPQTLTGICALSPGQRSPKLMFPQWHLPSIRMRQLLKGWHCKVPRNYSRILPRGEMPDASYGVISIPPMFALTDARYICRLERDV